MKRAVAKATKVDTVANLCKRRGLVFQSGEIYGGTKSAWDYGPLGVELKENIKKQWWRNMITSRDDVVGLDSAIILPQLPQRDHPRQLHLPHPRVRADGDGVWIDERTRWYVDLGIDPENLRLYDHPQEKLSHYSKRTVDVEYRFGFTGGEWGELEGIANRTDFDLGTHTEHSGESLEYFDQQSGERYTPYVIEPAAGLTRSLMAFLMDAYTEDEAPNTKGGVDKRTVLKLDRRLAPVKVAVLPLSRDEKLSPKARELSAQLRQYWNVDFDDAQGIGKRYRRQDEIGTPFCVTVDFDTLEDESVTVRERDTMAQERVPLAEIQQYLAARLAGC